MSAASGTIGSSPRSPPSWSGRADPGAKSSSSLSQAPTEGSSAHVTPLRSLHPAMSTSLKSIMFEDPFRLNPDDFVVLMMGPTGSGKTRFINKLTGDAEKQKAGDLQSSTQNVTPYFISHRGLRLVLVDTPSFDDAYRQDTEVLRAISDWLTQKYPDGTTVKISGIIYLHRITDNRMSASAYENLQLFSRLCGHTLLRRSRLVTTMWDNAKDQALARNRENQLTDNFWRTLIDGGAIAQRFHNTSASAWDIVEGVLSMGKNSDALLLQEELVEQQKHLSETEAGKTLYTRFQKPLDSKVPEEGEVIENGEIVGTQVNGDFTSKPPKAPKEALPIDTSSIPPPSEIPRRRPGPFDINAAKRDLSAPPLSALATARNIERLQDVEYPEGVRSPREDLNKDVKDGKFRYDRDFLMQFMVFCKEKPPNLPPLGILGIEPVDQSSFIMVRGGLGRHRQPPSAMTPTARQSSVGLGINSGIVPKPGAIPSPFTMGQFATQTSKLTSEERYLLSTGARSPSVSGGSASLQQFGRLATTRTASEGGPGGHPIGSNRTRSKRRDGRTDAHKVAHSQQGPLEGSGFSAQGAVPLLGAAFEPIAPFEMSANRWVAWSTVRKPSATDTESPELMDRKVRSLLNKLTMEKFDSISDQIIAWANESENEKDGRTLIRVIRLVLEKAADEAARSEMYARLCRKMMETISPKVQDDGIRNSEGKPIAGGQLFRKYLLNRCQEDFERGWLAREATVAFKASDGHAIKAANEKKREESEIYWDEYYAAQKAKRQFRGLLKFMCELFKLQMLTERIIHECVKLLLGKAEYPEEEEIESLCQLLKTVGQLLDVPKARAHMDVYFTRMKELCKSLNVSSRMQFMLQDVIELRDRKWVARPPLYLRP